MAGLSDLYDAVPVSLPRQLSLVLLCAAAIGCGESEPARAPSGLDADPWAPVSDSALAARITRAREDASASGRRVLLDFVADWCGDCREVVRLSHESPARDVIEERYIVIYVEVGRFDRHRALIAEHGVDRIATLVVLDPESGERIAKRTLEPIHGEQRGFTSAALAAWLREPTDA